jgi:hypothetical protein
VYVTYRYLDGTTKRRRATPSEESLPDGAVLLDGPRRFKATVKRIRRPDLTDPLGRREILSAALHLAEVAPVTRPAAQPTASPGRPRPTM